MGRIPRNFKTFIFTPKLPFLSENRKNDDWSEFLVLYEFSLYMIFDIFNEKSHFQNGHFQKIR